MIRQTVFLILTSWHVQAFSVLPPPRAHHPLASSVSTGLAMASTDEDKYARVPRRRRYRRYEDEEENRYEEDLYNDEDFDDENLFDDDDDSEDENWIGDEFQEEEEYELLSDIIIPNKLLDNIDPDGAAERFPELARDPRFWFDMFLFVCFLDFLSLAGPQDMFPDLPFS